jgi:hypothetical protein
MMRKRVILKLNEEQQRMLNFITGTLHIRADDFFKSVIPVHYAELNRLIEERLSEVTGPRGVEVPPQAHELVGARESGISTGVGV